MWFILVKILWDPLLCLELYGYPWYVKDHPFFKERNKIQVFASRLRKNEVFDPYFFRPSGKLYNSLRQGWSDDEKKWVSRWLLFQNDKTPVFLCYFLAAVIYGSMLASLFVLKGISLKWGCIAFLVYVSLVFLGSKFCD